MTRLFRSKSCSLARVTDGSNSRNDSSLRAPSFYETEDEEEEEEEDDDDDEEEGYFADCSPVTTPFISPERRQQRGRSQSGTEGRVQSGHHHQFPVLAVFLAALRKSLITCSVDRDDVANMDIGWPTDVRHISHVTFDRFNGFLGLPLELQPDVPRKVPSASASVFGVSAQSMQCSYDNRGNSVPTILLKMQNRLYSEGGLRAEGIFRINAENSKEENVRKQLNKGVVPRNIDVHCLAGLIKAWFRELPSGVLDSLTPEQVMHCNTEEECTQLFRLLRPTEAALLDWAINLMADVVQHEHHNKMNARNIAMVFAPNMTQMADPLTALIHAVQVMNFLKTLIMRTLQEREESAATCRVDCNSSTLEDDNESHPKSGHMRKQALDGYYYERSASGCLSGSANLERLDSETGEKFWSFNSKSSEEEEYKGIAKSASVVRKRCTLANRFRDEYDNEEVQGILERISIKKGVQKLCRHPVFQLSKPAKKSGVV